MPKVFYDDMIFCFSDEEDIYEPREDSYLLADVLVNILKKEQFNSIIDIGTGCGFLACIAKKNSENSKVFASDINKNAIKVALSNSSKNKLKINFILSDLFEAISGKFDLIVFNPPYLKKEDKKIKGSQNWEDNNVILRFLKQAKLHLNPHGKILILLSSLSDEKNFKEMEKRFKVKLLASRKIPWEELYVFELE
ncbi:MAG: Rossmann-like fold-containing protein [Candidatus Aenigmatarchaeota archaeon]|nr:tRNA (adenine(22)-N(1))-methyltransferase TrmK [Candidatus Aenigmarchaeota archaeon]